VKVAVVGGGSSYTPELADGLLDAAPRLGLRTLTLMDVDERRLVVLAGLVGRMAARRGRAVRVEATTDLPRALDGARFVVNQVRVGGMEGRRLDELIPREFGLVGQETTGPGGFSYAMRSVPVAFGIAREMASRCPEAWLLNFANPAGLVTEALVRVAGAKVVGLCNLPTITRRALAEALGVPPDELAVDVAGLNHLTWIRGVRHGDRDLTGEAFRAVREQPALAARLHADPNVVDLLGAIPSPYLRYYYDPGRMYREQLQDGHTRAELVQQIERQLLAEYARADLAAPPPLLATRGGAEYSRAAVALVRSLALDEPAVHVLNVAQHGELPDLPPGTVAELPCRVDRDAVRPLPVRSLEPQFRGLLQHVKAYEELAVEAARTGDHRAAERALASHPLVPSLAVARDLWRRLHQAHAEHLPQFAGR